MTQELLQQALDALLNVVPWPQSNLGEQHKAIAALRAAIAQPEQPADDTYDFIDNITVCSSSQCGPGKLILCTKCKQCWLSTL